MSQQNSDARKTLKELVDGIKSVFKRHSRSARDGAWSALKSKRAQEKIDQLIKNPSITVNSTNSWLSFKEYTMNSEGPNGPNGDIPSNRKNIPSIRRNIPSNRRMSPPPVEPKSKEFGHFSIKNAPEGDPAVYIFMFDGAEGENWKVAWVDHKHEFEKEIMEKGTRFVEEPEDYNIETMNDFTNGVEAERHDSQGSDEDFQGGQMWNFGYEIYTYANSMNDAKKLALHKLRSNRPDMIYYQPI